MMIEEEVVGSIDPIVHYQFGQQCLPNRDFAKALKHFKHAISLDPDQLDAEVYAFTAWLLAACPDAAIRDGGLAVQFATEACKLTDWLEGWTIGILAAALAQAGDIDGAIERQKEACERACDFDADMQRENLRLLQSGLPLPFNCYP
jgi:tetratricopeptide (TPR) repeat protein